MKSYVPEQTMEESTTPTTPRLDRQHVRVYRTFEEADDGGYMPGTPEERVQQVWELTREVWAFMPGGYVEQRLQRDVTVLIRGKR